MGRIKRFNLKKLMLQNQADFFFETGTWKGDGLAYAATFPFKKLYSSEIIETIAKNAVERFKNNNRVIIINKSSTDALKQYGITLQGNTIFWLDAHFPGAEEGINGYNEIEEETIKLPLQKELEMIAARKKSFKDIILIDDLRIYEEGAFESGNLPESVIPPNNRNTNFVETLFGNTHNIIKLYQDEGYLALLPKSLTDLSFLENFYFNQINKLFKKLL